MHRSLALIALLCTLPLLLVSFALSLRSDVLGFMALPSWQSIINDEQSSTTTTRRTTSSSRSYSVRTYSPYTATVTYIATPTTLTRTSTTTQLRSLTPLAGPTTFTVTFTDTDTYTFNTGLVTRTSFDFSRAQYTPPLSYSLTLSCVISGRCGDLSTATLAAQKRAVATPAVTAAAAAVVRRATPSTQSAAALARRAYPSTQAEQVAYYTDILAKLRAQTAMFFLKTLSSLALIVSIVVFVVLYRGRDRHVQQRVQEYSGNHSVKEDAEQAINRRTRTLSTFLIVIAVFTTSFFVFGLLGFILNAAFFGNGPIPPSYAAEIAFWTLSVVMLAASLVALVMDRRASAAQCQSVRYNSSFDTDTEVPQHQQQKHEEMQPTQATSMVTQMHDYNATAPIQPVSPQMMHGVYSPMQSHPQSPPQSHSPQQQQQQQPHLQPQAPQHNVNTVAYTNPLLGTAPAYSPT